MTNDSGWTDLLLAEGVTITNGTLKYRKVGNLVFLFATEVVGILGNGTKGTLPIGCRPTNTIYTVMTDAYPDYIYCGMVRIYSGGGVNLNYDTGASISSNARINFSIVFPV